MWGVNGRRRSREPPCTPPRSSALRLWRTARHGACTSQSCVTWPIWLCAICRLSTRPRHTASARCVRPRHMGTQTSCVRKIGPAFTHILVPRLNHTVAECVPDGLCGSRLHAFFIPPRGTISRRVSPWETVATEGREELKSDWDYHGFADSNAPTPCAIPISAYAHGGHHDLVLVAEHAPQVASRMVCKHH